MKYRGEHIRVSDLEIGDFIFVKRTLSDDERDDSEHNVVHVIVGITRLEQERQTALFLDSTFHFPFSTIIIYEKEDVITRFLNEEDAIMLPSHSEAERCFERLKATLYYNMRIIKKMHKDEDKYADVIRQTEEELEILLESSVDDFQKKFNPRQLDLFFRHINNLDLDKVYM